MDAMLGDREVNLRLEKLNKCAYKFGSVTHRLSCAAALCSDAFSPTGFSTVNFTV